MSLDAFLRHLHVDIDQNKPADWEVDWEDAPLAISSTGGCLRSRCLLKSR